MERMIFKIDNVNVARACVAFARELGCTITPDIDSAGVGNFLTTGSKKYDINWIKNESFVAKKGETPLVLTEDYPAFLGEVTENYLENLPSDDVQDDEISLDDDGPDAATVTALYNKVKGQKKSPSNYYLTYKNENWVATTVSEGSYANLAETFNNL